ncbi:MAG: 4Fe-4S dicluster domain-containing protein [Planctomycetes bacterium]|nr:4Fe-4S dicluster domain-containing protein [Planctomycetota bacterium]
MKSVISDKSPQAPAKTDQPELTAGQAGTQDYLRRRVSQLLETKAIGVFIGYEKGDNPELARPVMITEPSEADRLIYDQTCVVMLTKYLLKPEVKAYGKRGIIASYSNLRAIICFIQENQLKREDLYIIAALPECHSCGSRNPDTTVIDSRFRGNDTSDKKFYDEEVAGFRGYESTPPIRAGLRYDSAEEMDKKVKELMVMPADKRWAFWEQEFSKCIKCYACRQICPLCYCNRCIADKNQPQWIPTSPHYAGNFMWNLTRAYHLAGRCVDCGECERACPVGINLMLFNRMIYNNIKTNFNYEAGFDYTTPPPLATYHQDDNENFII